jgi:hypothetical protein
MCLTSNWTIYRSSSIDRQEEDENEDLKKDVTLFCIQRRLKSQRFETSIYWREIAMFILVGRIQRAVCCSLFSLIYI